MVASTALWWDTDTIDTMSQAELRREGYANALEGAALFDNLGNVARADHMRARAQHWLDAMEPDERVGIGVTEAPTLRRISGVRVSRRAIPK